MEVAKIALGALSRRLGTALAAFLLAHGLPPELTERVVVAVAALLAVGGDVVMSWWHDRSRQVLERLMQSRDL